MAVTNPNIAQEIKGYIDETREQLISKAVLGGKTIGLVNLMGGVKGKAALNILDTDVVLQDASTCGFNPVSSNAISRRYVEPILLGTAAEWCEKEFYDTYASHMLRTAAGQKNLPYQEDFINSIIENLNAQLEKMVWQGDSANTGATEFDGYLKLAEDASATTIDFASGSSVWTAIKEVYLNVPEEAMKDDLVIFVSAGVFRQFIQELVAANLYHYDPNDNPMEYRLPGTNHRVIAVNGLNGTEDADYIFATRLDNLIYATDLMSDKERFDFWFSPDNQDFRMVIEFFAGAQIMWPEEVVVGKIAK